MTQDTEGLTKGQLYYRAKLEGGLSNVEVAKKFGVNESTVRRAVKRFEEARDIDPMIADAMRGQGLEEVPDLVWVKTQEKDAYGRTYSFMVKPKGAAKEESFDERMTRAAELMAAIPAVKLERPKTKDVGAESRIGFIPVNDLHSGAYAWHKETGYGDWDVDLAVARLKDWLGRLIARMPVCGEVILYYNGDTLHTNGEVPLTPASGHQLDKDGRNFRVVDMTTAAIIATTELAAQKHQRVRLVIKRGNHDEDSYIALLMGAKWRFRDVKNIIVEEDPSPYWVKVYGSVMLFGHHGDRVRPEQLLAKMAADHPEAWGQTKHRAIWTAHKHHREAKQMPGATWEQASCFTAPDAYGAAWGSHAQAQAVIYHTEHGEIERYTVRP